MTYIEPVTDPEILKLGIRMVLYREKKPILREEYFKKHGHHNKFSEDIKEWQQSFIAYLKEPEFKVGDKVYRNKECLIIMDRFGQSNDRLWIWNKEKYYKVHGHRPYKPKRYDKDEFAKRMMDDQHIISIKKLQKDCSHYYPGQEWDGDIKYVREVKIEERQEPHQMKTKYGDYESKITVETWEWQEVEEPEERFEQKENYPKWDQFQEDKKQGKIIAIIKQ